MIEIVRQDFGALAANSVARRLVMPAHRMGGQAQFLERPVAHREGLEITPLLENVRANLAVNWSVERMAGECRMSVRTFLRRFSESMGQTPGDWLVAERVGEAQRLLCQGRQIWSPWHWRRDLAAPIHYGTISGNGSASARANIERASSASNLVAVEYPPDRSDARHCRRFSDFLRHPQSKPEQDCADRDDQAGENAPGAQNLT